MILCHTILKFSSASGEPPPDPLQVSSPSTSTPLPQISSYISEYVHCCPDMNTFIVWTHFYSMLYNFTTNATYSRGLIESSLIIKLAIQQSFCQAANFYALIATCIVNDICNQSCVVT